MAGWSSFNKYSLLGGLRSAAQVISYEIPLTLSVVGLLLLAGTMSLNQIALNQAGWFTDWYVFQQPLGALIFFIAATAEANRTPFDLTEADSEIVAGFATEYSGMRFGFFFFAEYVNVFVVSAPDRDALLRRLERAVPVARWPIDAEPRSGLARDRPADPDRDRAGHRDAAPGGAVLPRPQLDAGLAGPRHRLRPLQPRRDRRDRRLGVRQLRLGRRAPLVPRQDATSSSSRSSGCAARCRASGSTSSWASPGSGSCRRRSSTCSSRRRRSSSSTSR